MARAIAIAMGITQNTQRCANNCVDDGDDDGAGAKLATVTGNN